MISTAEPTSNYAQYYTHPLATVLLIADTNYKSHCTTSAASIDSPALIISCNEARQSFLETYVVADELAICNYGPFCPLVNTSAATTASSNLTLMAVCSQAQVALPGIAVQWSRTAGHGSSSLTRAPQFPIWISRRHDL